MKVDRRIAWALAVLLLAACRPAQPSPTPSTLRIAGSASMAPLLERLGKAFNERHPEVHLVVQAADTAFGLDALTGAMADMAAVSWLPEEMDEAWVATPIAWDGIAIVVHPDNPLEGLTMLQLRQLFAGWAFRWQDVGAPATGQTQPIQVLSREKGSGTRAVFEERVMNDERVTLTALVMPSGQAIMDYVTNHPQAVGYVSMGLASDYVKVLQIEGLYPTPSTTADGSYHLARPFYLITRGKPMGPGKQFIDFILSPTGQAIVGERYGRIR